MSAEEAQPMKEDSEEEVDRDSPDTDQSTQSADSSDDGFESDDSSEMDNEENEKRRIECLENIADIERQFTGLREQLYRERLTQVEYKLSEVKMGCATEYTEPLEELEQSCRIKTEVAAVLKQFRINNICNQFEAEELAAKQNLDSERTLLWDSIKEELEEKIRHLEEDRNNVDISSDLWFVEHSLTRGNKSKRGALAKQTANKPYSDMVSRRKPVTVTGPYIVYMLHENDIIEDWTIIKKALSVNKRKESKYY